MNEPTDDTAVGNAAFVLALRERGVRDTAVLRALEQVPRERFAMPAYREHARRDIALPLPCGQSMTAPTKIATMLSALEMRPGLRVLEIGTGSGYVAALLLHLGAARVRGLERCASLARAARTALGTQFGDVIVEAADGLAPGGAGEGTFERVLVNGHTADGLDHLAEALAIGGRLVGIGEVDGVSRLLTIERRAERGLVRTVGTPLRLPPLTPGRPGVS